MKRVRNTHMELETCKSFIESINNENLTNICLIHLSETTGDSDLFKDTIRNVTTSNVLVASGGVEFEIGLEPF